MIRLNSGDERPLAASFDGSDATEHEQAWRSLRVHGERSYGCLLAWQRANAKGQMTISSTSCAICVDATGQLGQPRLLWNPDSLEDRP